MGDLPEAPPVESGDQVLRPSQVVWFERPGVADGVLHGQPSEVIGGQWRLPADAVANALDDLAHVFQAQIGGDAPGVHGVLLVRHHGGVQVHLEELEAAIPLAPLHALAVDLRIGNARGVAIDQQAVVELVAQKAPRRHAVHFARQIVEPNIDGAISAAARSLKSEPANPRKDRVDFQGIPAYHEGLQQQGLADHVVAEDLAQAIDALVGVDTDDGIVVIRRDGARREYR